MASFSLLDSGSRRHKSNFSRVTVVSHNVYRTWAVRCNPEYEELILVLVFSFLYLLSTIGIICIVTVLVSITA